MKNIEYRLVQEEKAVYQLEEDCCFTKVIFDGPAKGIYERLDRYNEQIGVLICHCHPKIEIVPISKEFYQTYYNLVHESLLNAQATQQN
jgi:hypothetical protein